MKLPSIRHLKKEALDTATRFPFTILSAFVATIAIIVIVDYDYSVSCPYKSLYNISAIAFLAISLFCSLQLMAERMRWRFLSAVIGKTTLLVVLILYYYSLPTNIFDANVLHFIRYMLFAIAAHLLVAVAPFTGKGHINAFWEYNKVLFLRYLTAVLYSGVLYIGLVIALVAIEHLFNIDIKDIRYFQLWWLLVGIFNTWFFLSGVPKKLASLDAGPRYPKGLKIFTQYVMIPLVAVYVLILYVYMGKIIVEWDWPKGWVAYLVTGFSITGIFSLLLIYPIKDQQKNKWMAEIWRWFFYILIPLVVLLLLAAWRRISEYGITERRYFVLVLGIWLAAIAIYFILSKLKNIKIIPLSLCIIALSVSFGPWGAFIVSEWSQINRLKEVLIKHNILIDGKIHKNKKKIPFEDAKQISSVVRYLSETHGFAGIQPWFDEKLDTLASYANGNRYYKHQEIARQITNILAVQYVSEYELNESDRVNKNFYFHINGMFILEPKTYRYLVNDIDLNAWSNTLEFTVGKRQWKVILQPDSLAIVFKSSNYDYKNFSVGLEDFTTRLKDHYGVHEYGNNYMPPDSMAISVTRNDIEMMLYFKSIQIMTDSTGMRINSVSFIILMNS